MPAHDHRPEDIENSHSIHSEAPERIDQSADAEKEDPVSKSEGSDPSMNKSQPVPHQKMPDASQQATVSAEEPVLPSTLTGSPPETPLPQSQSIEPSAQQARPSHYFEDEDLSSETEKYAAIPRSVVANGKKTLRSRLTRPEMPAVFSKVLTRPEMPVTPSPIQSEAGPGALSIPSNISQAQQLERLRQHRKTLLRYQARKKLRRSRNDESRTFKRFWIIVGSIVASILVIFLSLSAAGTYAAFSFYNSTSAQYQKQVSSLRDLVPRDNLKMYDSKGVFLGQMTNDGIHTSVKLNQITPNLINATVAIEDKAFWSNEGVDLGRIIQSAIDDLQSGQVVGGGSTITQQLIKNLVVGSKVDVLRKLQEIVLTPEVNSQYSKSDIIEMYLNTIYYGEQSYGIDAAASTYFGYVDQPGKPASAQLDLAQAAMLAGTPNSPDAFDPLQHPKAALGRMSLVLNAMVTQKYITRAQASDAYDEAQGAHFYKRPPTFTNRAPHFFNFVLRTLAQQYHLKKTDLLARSDMKVYTTLDIGLQDKIQKIAQNQIALMQAQGHNMSNAAEVIIDYHTGAIISLLGSIDYNNKSIDGEFDVATEGYRQPGSSFKPYVYVTAFKQGASGAQAVADDPTTFPDPGADPPVYEPKNYDLNYHGHMTIRCALQNSLNIPAVRTLNHVGISAAMQTAKDMGITSTEGTPGLSLVLGGLDVNLLEHTSAFGTFGNAGVHVPYYAVQKITYGNSQQSVTHTNAKGTRAITAQQAYMMTNILSDNTSRLPEFYDCNVLQLYSNSQDSCYNGDRGTVRPAAAKTGTTNDFRDNWTLGYTTDYVMGVWSGNDDNTPMNDVIGVQGAAPIWHDAMLLAEQNHPIKDFTNPGGLQWETAHYSDGVTASDWFQPNTVPSGSTGFFSDSMNTNSNVSAANIPNPPTTPAPKAQGPYCPSGFSFSGGAQTTGTTPTPGGNPADSNAEWW